MNVASEKVFEERNSSVQLGETIRFHLPPSIALLNSQETFLKFNVVVGSKGQQEGFATGDEAEEDHYFPWTFGQGGVANLIKNLTIKTSDGVILEQITDYNRLNRVLCNYVENPSERNLKRLYQGADVKNVKEFNTLTRRTNTGGVSTIGTTQENMEVEVCLPFILSGILNNPQPFPNMLAPLVVEILLEENPLKVIHTQGQQLGGEASNFINDKDAQNLVMGFSEEYAYKCEGTPSSATQTSLNILTGNSGGNNVFTGSIDNSQVPNFPFYNGQTVVIKGTADIEVRINQITRTADKLQIIFDSTDFGGNAVANPKIFVKVPENVEQNVNITLSEMELVCGTVQPDPKQLQALESAVRSGTGYGFQYKSYTDFPVNMSAGALQVSNLINCNFRMTKAILSFWENVGDTDLVNRDNLEVQNDSNIKPKSYQYRLKNLLTPNREVDLTRYQKTRAQSGGWSASHIKELEQALGCCGWQVKDLSNIDGCLLLGRGLVPVNSGFTYDMSDNEESRIQLKYTAQSQSLLQHNYICYLKELRISAKGKMVIE